MSLVNRVGYRPLPAAVALALSICLMSGCGDPEKNNILKGNVTVDGRAGAYDIVVLHYDDGTTREFETTEDGSFHVKGARFGTVKVAIRAKLPNVAHLAKANLGGDPEEQERILRALTADAEMVKQDPAQVPEAAKAQYKAALMKLGTPLPLIYASPDQSGFTWQIGRGVNEQNFDMTFAKMKGKRPAE
jgi:hypothetical protein